MEFIKAHPGFVIGMLLVFAGLMWLAISLSEPTREEKQEERRRRLQHERYLAVLADRQGQLVLERGKAAGRTPRGLKPKAPQAGRPMTLNTEAEPSSGSTSRISRKLGGEASQ